MPAVSILMLSFNRPQYIGQAIESILNQTFDNFELLIFDNGADTKPYEIAKQYADKDSRIRLLREEKRLGTMAARARIAKMAQAEYIATIEDDDWWVPEKLEKQYAFMERNKHVGVYCCSFHCVDKHGSITGETLLKDAIMPPTTKPGDICHFGLYYLGSGQLYRRDVFMEINRRREYFRIAEDVDNFCRLQEKYHYASTSERLIYYRIWGNNISLKNMTQTMYGYAAYISAVFRRKNLPDPVRDDIPVEDFIADFFHKAPEFPTADNHLSCERRIAKHFLRNRYYDVLNRFLHNRPSTLAGRGKLYLKLIIWSFLHKRLGYWLHTIKTRYAKP